VVVVRIAHRLCIISAFCPEAFPTKPLSTSDTLERGKFFEAHIDRIDDVYEYARKGLAWGLA
jgi:hypothetical protein